MSRLFSGLIAVTLLSGVPLRADYVTPGSGVRWTLDSLVVYSEGAVAGDSGYFEVSETVIVANGDTLVMAPGDSLVVLGSGAAVTLEINGALDAVGSESDSIRVTAALGQPDAWYGLRYRDTGPGSFFRLRYASVEFARRAVDVVGADAEVEDCRIAHSQEVAVDLSASNSLIRNNHIVDNRQRAIQMTLSSAPLIEGNVLRRNNLEDSSPYNFISIGLQGVNSPRIVGNHIVGGVQRSGGISIWANSQAVIEANRIENCAFGILCFQPGANPLIRGNTIVNNTVNPDTALYGFAIASNGANRPIVSENRISGHFYGVAIINGGQPVLGDLGNLDTRDDGGNFFLGNGIGSNRYEVFNNNSLSIKAENNWWGTADADSIAARIVDQSDNPQYGPVDYDPFMTDTVMVAIAGETGVLPSAGFEIAGAWPNPFNPAVNLTVRLGRSMMLEGAVHDVLGRRVRDLGSRFLVAGEHAWRWDGRGDGGGAVASGWYVIRISGEGGSAARRVLLVR